MIPLYERGQQGRDPAPLAVGQGSGATPSAASRSGNCWRSANIWPSSFPLRASGPRTRRARALARAVSRARCTRASRDLRVELSMNMRRVIPGRRFTADALAADRPHHRRSGATAARVTARAGAVPVRPFHHRRRDVRAGGERFRTYEIDARRDGCDAYADAIWSLPAMIAWCEAAAKETIVIDKFEFEPGGSI